MDYNLRADKRYRYITRTGLKQIGTDIVRSGDGEFRTDVSFGLKFGYYFAKNRVIRKEVCASANDLLCKLLNYKLQWPRKPESVRNICEMSDSGFIWMRFDVPRVTALFLKCQKLLTDPEYRNLIKNYSSIAKDKNARLTELISELDTLKKRTILSIKTKGIFDGLIDVQKEEFYMQNEKEIQDKFLNSSQGGSLGFPPTQIENGNNDEKVK